MHPRGTVSPRASALSAAFALGLMLPSTAFAASGDRIGDAVVITNIVMADFDEKQRQLAVGDDVRQDETIEVNTDAKGEFKLDDDTKLALGPGAKLVLDKFVYDSDKKAGSIIINLAKGAFRFITGIAAKQTYVVNTPNASITVRGTIFDVYVLPDKSAWVLLHEGALEASGKKNVCRVLDQPGQLIRITPDGTIGTPMNWSSLPEKNAVAFDTAFPFVINAPTVDPNPLLTRDAIINAAFPQAPEKTCINPHFPTKVRKVDTGPGNAAPNAKKQKAANVPKRQPTKTAKGSDDDWGNGARGMDIVIGVGVGMGKIGRHRNNNPDLGDSYRGSPR
jgi:hypothetical protein